MAVLAEIWLIGRDDSRVLLFSENTKAGNREIKSAVPEVAGDRTEFRPPQGTVGNGRFGRDLAHRML